MKSLKIETRDNATTGSVNGCILYKFSRLYFGNGIITYKYNKLYNGFVRCYALPVFDNVQHIKTYFTNQGYSVTEG